MKYLLIFTKCIILLCFFNSVSLSQQYSLNISAPEFCSTGQDVGIPLNFAISDGNNDALMTSNGTWSYSDDGGMNFNPIVPASGFPAFNGTGFNVNGADPNMNISDCADHPTGFVDRIFKFSWDGNSVADTVRICCPPSVQSTLMTITNENGDILSSPLCGAQDVNVQFEIQSNLPIPNGSLNNVTTMLLVNGLYEPGFDNLISIDYDFSINSNTSFNMVISNCACPAITIFLGQISIVQPPTCGTIKPTASSPLISTSDTDSFLICPDDAASLEIDQPFSDCNTSMYEYSFDQVNWSSLGSSNAVQNTNVLPQLSPANSPYLWTAGVNCIYYRYSCNPPPNTPCTPCYSNIITICLLEEMDTPVISANPNPLCEGELSTLDVQNPEPNHTYTWYHNGLVFGTGYPLQTNLPGNYWVVVTDEHNCHSKKSEIVKVEECILIPVISCPLPTCPKIGEKITLSPASSYSTCSQIVSYSWDWDSGEGEVQNNNDLIHVPTETGSTYTLMIVDEYGCSKTTQLVVAPCVK